MTLQVLVSSLGAIALFIGTIYFSSNSANAINFTPPPDSSTPRQGSGGASRSTFQFTPPPSNSSPRQGSGGASRSGFTPPPSNSSSRQGSVKNPRDDDFTPPPSNSSSRQGSGTNPRNDDFTPPADNTKPHQSSGGSARTSSQNAQRLGVKPLVPESYYGTTLQEHPTILVYVPASNAQEAVFSIKDENKNMVHQIIVPLSGVAEVISLKLPETAPALQINQNYQWYFALKADGELTPRSPFVDGWVKRIEPNFQITQALQNTDTLETAAIFAAHGVWYDCAAILASLQAAQPSDKNLQAHWEELLHSVGLVEIASAPLAVSF